MKSADILAKPVQLYLNKDSNFKTFCGGILSLIVFLILIGIFIFKLEEVFARRLTYLVTREE